MSGGGGGGAHPAGKPGAAAPQREAYIDLAEKIYINLAARVYGTLSGSDQKKPDPKALAAFCFKLSDAFEQASKETDREKARLDAEAKSKVNLADVDLSSVFASTKKP
jgi:hypothetical protein